MVSLQESVGESLVQLRPQTLLGVACGMRPVLCCFPTLC